MTAETQVRPDDTDEQTPPADDAAASGEAHEETPSDGDQAAAPAPEADATAQVTALDAELASLRDKLETAEKKRIPGLQAQIDAKERERVKAIEDARTYRAGMLEWTRQTMVRNGLEDEWREIERQEQERTGRVLETQASRAETMETINELLDSDTDEDRAFGRYLRHQVKAATEGGVPVRVSKANLGTFKAMFDQGRGITPARTDDAPPPVPTTRSAAAPAAAAAPKSPAPKAPPKTAGASGAPQTEGEPAYKPGMKPRDLFNRAFRGDRA